jgi:aryl-alcohol dehydrogenase-like predicted oxidoreductase
MSDQRMLAGEPIFPIGLGCMPMSLAGRPPDERGIRTIHAALDAGVRLLDTADSYCEGEDDVGRNERLIARALRTARRDDVIVATKGGHTRPGGRWGLDGRPEQLRAACERSLRALDVDVIDLYQLHRPDPKVPFAESVGALRDLRDEGKVRLVGLSNVDVAQLEQACEMVEVASVQNELSPRYLAPLHNGEVQACEKRGIALLAWSPLGGVGTAATTSAEVSSVREVAATHGVSPQRVTLGWLLRLSHAILPIPGASRPETALDSIAAAALELEAEEIERISTTLGLPV